MNYLGLWGTSVVPKSQAHILCQYSPFSSLSQDTFFFFFLLPIFNVFVCLFWIRNSYLRQNRRLEGDGGCFVVEMFWAGFLLPREAFVIKLYAHAAGWVRSRNYIKSVLWYAPLWGNKENLMLNILVFCSLVLFLFPTLGKPNSGGRDQLPTSCRQIPSLAPQSHTKTYK